MKRTCARCRLLVEVTSSGHVRAHACPHGRSCQPSYRARRLGVRPADCPDCRASHSKRHQLRLFDAN